VAATDALRSAFGRGSLTGRGPLAETIRAAAAGSR
jgi:hypothetical protein